MSLNKVLIDGNLGKDPDMKMTPTGTPVCRFSICTNDYMGKGKDGKPRIKENWHSIVVYGPQAESAGKYLKKGRRVLVEGRIDYWETEDKKKHGTQILMEKFHFLDAKPGEKAAPAEAGADIPSDDVPF